MMNSQIWLVTGVSGGIGRAVAEQAALAGHTVYGTLRKNEQTGAFEQLVPGKTHAILLDVNDHAAAAAAVNDIIRRHGRLDVLVNNAGYGLFGAIEEVTMEESRMQMETNFFATLNLVQQVLPHMRTAGYGRIVQVSSIAGIRGTMGLGIYNASKFALEGYSEALAQEVAPFGIRIVLAEPGPFRTNWAGSSSIRSQKIMPEYAETAHVRIDQINGYSGTQPGSPEKAARVILEAVESEDSPLHLLLGPLAIQGARDKMQALEEDIRTWEARATDTSF